MNLRYLLTLIVLAVCAGCATKPIVTDLPTLAENPSEFRNKRVEISGHVIENPPPQGDEYRTWSFVIGAPNVGRVMASEEGYNPATIEKAYRLVERAREAGKEVTIMGKLRVGPYREIESGMEIDLDAVQYDGVRINTDRGPFVGPRYPYDYPGPIFWHFGYYYY